MTKPVQVTLPESLKIAQAHALHDEFEALLQKSSSEALEIDASSVGTVDTAGIQLVVALVKSTKERHMSLAWSGASACFSDAVKTLGLQSALEMS